MSHKDPEGPRRTKKDPVRLSKLRQTSQAAFAASSFSSWLNIMYKMSEISIKILLKTAKKFKISTSTSNPQF